MAQFHETGYGRRFFDSQLPDLIDAIRELGQQTARQNVLMEKLIEQGEASAVAEGPEIDKNFLKHLRKGVANGLGLPDHIAAHVVGLGIDEMLNKKWDPSDAKKGDKVIVTAADDPSVKEEGVVLANNTSLEQMFIEFKENILEMRQLAPAWVNYDQITLKGE